MIVGILILALFIFLGVIFGLDITIPYSYSEYVAVAIIACFDSVMGALVASRSKKFKMHTFLSGFFGNSIVAIFLVYLGHRLNVDLYLAAVIVFVGRILTNFSLLRNEAVDNIDKNTKLSYAKRRKNDIN